MATNHVTSRIVSVWLCVAFLAAAPASAQTGHDTGERKGRSRFDGLLSIATYYDDNVFNYSDENRATFEADTAPPSRFPIDNLGDYVTAIAARGDYLWRIHRHSYWRVSLSYAGRFYALNTGRTYHTVGFELRRKLPRFSTELSMRFTPDFYLRNLYWRPMPSRPPGVTYAAARFSRLSTTLDTRFFIRPRVSGRVVLGHAWRNYGAPFDERDNNTYDISAGVQFQPARRLDVYVAASAATSRASGANATSPDVDDISNNVLGGLLRATVVMGADGRFELQESIAYGHQTYTTNNPADAYHYHRSDDEYRWHNELRWHASPSLRPGVFYDYRASTTSVVFSVPDVGQYTGSRFGVELLRTF